MSHGFAIGIGTHETFPDVDSREVMAAYGEPRSFFLGQIAEFHTLESSMRTHKFREAVAVVGVDKTECLQCIQCDVKIRDLLWDDD